ncbi:hypothetical protein [Pedobacter nototheniae]|uniref:hypothetical protein n=1 Tax=Pedobacter nototheniae TaxID=2488994 RepID=UPI00292CDDDE|nr:hypothetical protein [Pedobacter nototheniae]
MKKKLITLKTSKVALILSVLFLSNCKKDEIVNHPDGYGTKKNEVLAYNKNTTGTSDIISLPTNTQLELGILDSVTLNKIEGLTLNEQKAFWYIVSDIETEGFDEFAIRIHSANLNIFPFPMIEPNSQPSSAGEFVATPSNLYTRISNPHSSLTARKIRNFDNLIDAMPLISGYINVFTGELLYSILLANDGSPYFSVAALSVPIVEDQDNPGNPE